MMFFSVFILWYLALGIFLLDFLMGKAYDKVVLGYLIPPVF